VVEGIALLFATLLFPVMMSHMAMPVTKRAWLLHKMSPAFFRTLPAIVYWCFFFVLSLLPAIGCVVAAGLLSGRDVAQVSEGAAYNTAIYVHKGEIDDIPKGKNIPKELQEWSTATPVDVDFSKLYLPAGLLALGAGFFGLVAVFSMRTNGLFTHYFLNRLDLETMTVEVKYVPKAKSLTELEEQKTLSWKTALMPVAIGFAMGFTLGGSWGMNGNGGFLNGAAFGMSLAGGIALAVGIVWTLYSAVKPPQPIKPGAEPPTRWSALRFPVAVLGAGLVYGAIGAMLVFHFKKP
jgi:hypothetical protein